MQPVPAVDSNRVLASVYRIVSKAKKNHRGLWDLNVRDEEDGKFTTLVTSHRGREPIVWLRFGTVHSGRDYSSFQAPIFEINRYGLWSSHQCLKSLDGDLYKVFGDEAQDKPGVKDLMIENCMMMQQALDTLINRYSHGIGNE